jgi:hypothetical protein
MIFNTECHHLFFFINTPQKLYLILRKYNVILFDVKSILLSQRYNVFICDITEQLVADLEIREYKLSLTCIHKHIHTHTNTHTHTHTT